MGKYDWDLEVHKINGAYIKGEKKKNKCISRIMMVAAILNLLVFITSILIFDINSIVSIFVTLGSGIWMMAYIWNRWR